jgi:plastocyanin
VIPFSPRRMAALAAACGEAIAAPSMPQETLAPGVYGPSGISSPGAATPSPSPSPSPSATPSASPTASGSPGSTGGPCNSCGTVVTGVTPTVVVDANDQLRFVPQTVSVKVGDVVEWKNVGTVLHSVTFQSDQQISDATLGRGQSFEVKFTQAGSFAYVCVYHQSLGMIGTVDVSAG